MVINAYEKYLKNDDSVIDQPLGKIIQYIYHYTCAILEFLQLARDYCPL